MLVQFCDVICVVHIKLCLHVKPLTPAGKRTWLWASEFRALQCRNSFQPVFQVTNVCSSGINLTVYLFCFRITNPCRTLSLSWVWMSCLKKTSSLQPVPVKCRGSFPSLSRWLRCSLAPLENMCLSEKLLLDSREFYMVGFLTVSSLSTVQPA